MYYNLMKFLHIIIAGLLVGGHFCYIFFNLAEKKLNYNKFILVSLVLQLFTGFYLLNEAGFYLDDIWLLIPLMILCVNILLSLLILMQKVKSTKKIKLYNILMFILLIIAICLMVYKPELD